MTNLFLKKIINHFSHVIISCLILVSAAVEQWNEEFHFTWMIISISVSLGLQPWQPSEQTEKWITIYKYLTKDVIESRLRPSHSTALSRDCYLLGCGWTSKCLLSCFTGEILRTDVNTDRHGQSAVVLPHYWLQTEKHCVEMQYFKHKWNNIWRDGKMSVYFSQH